MRLSAREDLNRRMLRARDEMDRRYAEPLDVPALAAVAQLSTSHFGRVFKAVYGETPHRYLQRRRVERAMTLLQQTDRPITTVAWDVGFASLGTFSSTFSGIVGCSPSRFRAQHGPVAVPSCFIAAWTRPRTPESAGPQTTTVPVPEARSPQTRTRIPDASGSQPDGHFEEAGAGEHSLAFSS